MSSLNADFDSLLGRIKHGRDLDYASAEPVFYLVFQPQHILAVKRELPAWTSRLKNDGFTVEVFSIAEHIEDILRSSPVFKIWENADKKTPLAWGKTNRSLANEINKGELQNRIAEKLSQLAEQKNGILLVTDLEALHPYIRIGTIEGGLLGKFSVPTVFFYPGERTGSTQLKFLGCYPEDGNYRSVHVGG